MGRGWARGAPATSRRGACRHRRISQRQWGRRGRRGAWRAAASRRSPSCCRVIKSNHLKRCRARLHINLPSERIQKCAFKRAENSRLVHSNARTQFLVQRWSNDCSEPPPCLDQLGLLRRPFSRSRVPPLPPAPCSGIPRSCSPRLPRPPASRACPAPPSNPPPSPPSRVATRARSAAISPRGASTTAASDASVSFGGLLAPSLAPSPRPRPPPGPPIERRG